MVSLSKRDVCSYKSGSNKVTCASCGSPLSLQVVLQRSISGTIVWLSILWISGRMKLLMRMLESVFFQPTPYTCFLLLIVLFFALPPSEYSATSLLPLSFLSLPQLCSPMTHPKSSLSFPLSKCPGSVLHSSRPRSPAAVLQALRIICSNDISTLRKGRDVKDILSLKPLAEAKDTSVW